ncbi:MAG: Gfo/Idh/MocA family protein [Verrucomicrobiia bacterium]
MKKLNVGIVGYGWAAGAHIAAIQSGALGQVTAVCSSRALDSREVSTRHGCPIQVHTDLNAMLSDKNLDVVSISSYHAQHKEHTLAAVRAGKHVIVEKPLALNLADVREIEAAVRKAGVNFCICFELRFSSQFRAIRSVLDRGLLGSLHYAEVDYYHGIGPWYREFEWCTTNEACGSSLLAAGCHAMDALLLCMDREVEEVFAVGSRSDHPTYAKYRIPSDLLHDGALQGWQSRQMRVRHRLLAALLLSHAPCGKRREPPGQPVPLEPYRGP